MENSPVLLQFSNEEAYIYLTNNLAQNRRVARNCTHKDDLEICSKITVNKDRYHVCHGTGFRNMK